MKATIRTIFAFATICFVSFQTTQAATPVTSAKNNTEKKSTEPAKSNEEAHFVKGATMDNFVMPVNPMQKPVKAPLV